LDSSVIVPVNCKSFFFAQKVRLKDLKFEFIQFKLEQNYRLTSN